jgi:hypothetical protein
LNSIFFHPLIQEVVMELQEGLATLLLDPTGSLFATRLATEAAGATSKAAGAVSDKVKEAAGGSGSAPGGVTALPCCKEFELRDGFLLNTRTGAIWQYDNKESKFKSVERVDSEVSKAAWKILGSQLIDELLKQEAKAELDVHHSVAAEFRRNINAMVEILQDRMR